MNLIKRLLVAIVVSATLALAAGRLGWLEGPVPNDLGVTEGRLKPPARVPNSVSSQADPASKAFIEPLQAKFGDRDGRATLAALQTIVQAMPGAEVVKSDGPYLYAQFTSMWFRFVDDTEFWFDAGAGVVHERSASRLGESDLGVNRARIESIRAQLAASP